MSSAQSGFDKVMSESAHRLPFRDCKIDRVLTTTVSRAASYFPPDNQIDIRTARPSFKLGMDVWCSAGVV